MGALEDIVSVDITLESLSASRAGFGTLMVLFDHTYWADRIRTYGAAADLLTDFPADSAIVKAGQQYFSQEPRPTALKIGRRKVTQQDIQILTAVDSTNYTAIVNGNTYTIGSGGGATLASIATALAAAIDADPGVDAVAAPGAIVLITLESGFDGMTIALLDGETKMVHHKQTPLITIDEVLDNTDYYVQVFDQSFTVNSGLLATATTIRDALIAAITTPPQANFGASPVSANSFAILCDLDMCFVYADPDLMTVSIPAETHAAALTAISDVDDDYYGVAQTCHIRSEQLALGAAVQTLRKLHGFAATGQDIWDIGITTDIFSVMKGLSYTRSFGLYNESSILKAAENEFAEIAWFGKRLTLDLDVKSDIWAFQALTGVTPSTLNASKRNAIIATSDDPFATKCGNIYTTVAGANITERGIVFGGFFIDTIIGRDWLEARMKEAVFGRLASGTKVPYTDGGVAEVVNLMVGVLQTGQNTTYLDKDLTLGPLGFRYSFPRVANVPAADKEARKLRNVNWQARHAGAIQAVAITGTISF